MSTTTVGGEPCHMKTNLGETHGRAPRGSMRLQMEGPVRNRVRAPRRDWESRTIMSSAYYLARRL